MVEAYRAPVREADRCKAGLALHLVAARTGASPDRMTLDEGGGAIKDDQIGKHITRSDDIAKLYMIRQKARPVSNHNVRRGQGQGQR